MRGEWRTSCEMRKIIHILELVINHNQVVSKQNLRIADDIVPRWMRKCDEVYDNMDEQSMMNQITVERRVDDEPHKQQINHLCVLVIDHSRFAHKCEVKGCG